MPQGRLRTAHQAEALAAVFPPLLAAAEKVASTVAQGVHGRRRSGQGESFWQFRRYQPGDQTARIDWRRSGKSDHVYVREHEWEAAQSVWLWRDGSRSMDYRSAAELPTKLDRASLLLLATASLLLRAGERTALLGSGATPATGSTVIHRIAHAIDPESGGDIHSDQSLPPYVPLPRYSGLLLIGDFLDPPEAVEAVAARFAGRGVRGHIVQVLDPAETALPFGGRVRFEGLESEGSALIPRVETIRDQYDARMNEQQEALANIARRHGWTYIVHRTDHPPQVPLLSLYMSVSEGTGR
ncbi:MAG: DUF58 domain-containing protein [Acetobacterales bacterium]